MRKPAKSRKQCGTAEGHRQHVKRDEQDCEPCAAAWVERLKEPRHSHIPSAAEVAEEIEWMLKLNEGTGYILHAIGYTGRENALRTRLALHGYNATTSKLLGADQAA
jgi:hypothetical protein